jgi:hypothetical protein
MYEVREILGTTGLPNTPYVNSVIRIFFCLSGIIYVVFLSFFGFSLCISKLVMKIIGIVNSHLANTHNFFSKFLETYNLNINEWY